MGGDNKLALLWTEGEINKRLPVWLALSEFWLDNELQETDYDAISETLKASSYTEEEIWQICIYEVAPAVSDNLRVLSGGVWTGFNLEWLREAIIKKSDSPLAYLNPSLWERYKGMRYGSFLKSSGWQKVVENL